MHLPIVTKFIVRAAFSIAVYVMKARTARIHRARYTPRVFLCATFAYQRPDSLIVRARFLA